MSLVCFHTVPVCCFIAFHVMLREVSCSHLYPLYIYLFSCLYMLRLLRYNSIHSMVFSSLFQPNRFAPEICLLLLLYTFLYHSSTGSGCGWVCLCLRMCVCDRWNLDACSRAWVFGRKHVCDFFPIHHKKGFPLTEIIKQITFLYDKQKKKLLPLMQLRACFLPSWRTETGKRARTSQCFVSIFLSRRKFTSCSVGFFSSSLAGTNRFSNFLRFSHLKENWISTRHRLFRKAYAFFPAPTMYGKSVICLFCKHAS